MKLMRLIRWALLGACLLSMSSAHEDPNIHHHPHLSQAERKLEQHGNKDAKFSLPNDASVSGEKDNADGKDDDHGHDHSRCGTADPTVEEVANIHQLVAEYREGSRGDFRTNVTVPICFHVIMNTTGHGAFTDEQLQLQVDALNVAYSSSSCCDDSLYWCQNRTCSSETGFRFEMRNDCVTRTVDNDWYDTDRFTSAEIAMRKRLRVGGPDVLNVYYRDLPGGLLGYAWFPWDLDDAPLWADGINMDNAIFVGGTFQRFDEGDTLAHEVGHWLGLYHTFQFGCSPSEGILDTNPEEEPARGCSIGTDTCPGGSVGTGEDPIHNFMDYTDDVCMFEFTSDQIDVMHVSYAVYRAERVTREVLTLENGVISEPLTLSGEEMQVYSYEVETAGAMVSCVVSYVDELTGAPCTSACQNGDADLYLRWGAEPTRFEYDCSSTSFDSFESCTSQVLDGVTLYVGVYAFVAFLDLTTTCSEIENLIPLVNNIASEPVSLVEDAIQSFYLPVLFSPPDVTCVSNSDNGNADLFLRFEGVPDIVEGLYNCASSGDTSDEECTLFGVPTGNVFVSILATSSFTNLTVTCFEVAPMGAIALENGVASDRLSLRKDGEQYYYYHLEFPDTTSSVTCTTTGLIGDADLLLQWNEYPVRGGSSDCGSFSGGPNERCDVDVPFGATSLYILVFASSLFVNLRLTCFETQASLMPTLSPTETAGPSVVDSLVPTNLPSMSSAPTSEGGAIVLRNEVPSEFLSLPLDGEQYYLYPWEFPDALGTVNCFTRGSNGDADMMMKWDDPPVRLGSYDCESLGLDSNESCVVDAPFGASSLYILVCERSERSRSSASEAIFRIQGFIFGLPSSVRVCLFLCL